MVYSRLLDLVHDGSLTDAEIKEIIVCISILATYMDHSHLDDAFRDADPTRMSAVAMTTMLRSAYRARADLPHYRALLLRCRCELDKRGASPKLLRGLWY